MISLMPIEKPCQLMMALFDVCVIAKLPFTGVPIVTLPEATVPPVGSCEPPSAGAVASPASDAAVTILRRGLEKGGNAVPRNRERRAESAPGWTFMTITPAQTPP